MTTITRLTFEESSPYLFGLSEMQSVIYGQVGTLAFPALARQPVDASYGLHNKICNYAKLPPHV